jgi:hypothetical protein
LLTTKELSELNRKTPSYSQVEELSISWIKGEPVALALTLRASEAKLSHTKLIIRAVGISDLRVLPDKVGYPEIGSLHVRDISDRGWEGTRYEVFDQEQSEALTFYCADLEAQVRTY